jgi:hypothetical protein
VVNGLAAEQETEAAAAVEAARLAAEQAAAEAAAAEAAAAQAAAQAAARAQQQPTGSRGGAGSGSTSRPVPAPDPGPPSGSGFVHLVGHTCSLYDTRCKLSATVTYPDGSSWLLEEFSHDTRIDVIEFSRRDGYLWTVYPEDQQFPC